MPDPNSRAGLGASPAARHASVPTAPIELRIKKLPKELRRRPFRADAALPWHRRIVQRLRHDPLFLRHAVQLGFVALCVWIGVEFAVFVDWGLSTDAARAADAASAPQRPAGADAFLPISGLLGLVAWVRSGELNAVHPAATVVLLAAVATGWLVKKSFCSWICPLGTLGEALAWVGRRVFGRNVVPWRWLDWPLRSLKYLLLAFFVGSIATMSALVLGAFVDGAYNRVADIEMYLFFARITPVAASVFAALAAASVLIDRFWCRYLCPYGALLGAVGLVAPLRVARVKSRCIDCELCSRACPSRIAVHRVGARRAESPTGHVVSDECSSCLRCVDACPVRDTLFVGTRRGAAVSGRVVAAVAVGAFVAVVGAAMLVGRWDNAIESFEYRWHFERLRDAAAGSGVRR